MSDIQAYLKCPYCEKLYDQPVILPCEETICKSDLNDLYIKQSDGTNTIRCPYCSQLHHEPPNGFQEDKNLRKIIQGLQADKQTTNIGEHLKLAMFCCNKAVENLKEYEQIRANPDLYLGTYFIDIRNRIDEDRNEKKATIDSIYDHMLNELHEIEAECKSSIKIDDNYLNDLQEETSKYKIKLNEFVNELKKPSLDEKSCELIKQEARRLERELEFKQTEAKASFLMNKNFSYEAQKLEMSPSQLGKIVSNKLAPVPKQTEPPELPNPTKPKTTNVYNAVKVTTSTLKKQSSSEKPKQVRFNDIEIEEEPKKEVLIENDVYFIALFDYKNQKNDELSYNKGDILYVKEDEKYNDEEWYATIHACSKSKATSASSAQNTEPNVYTRRKSIDHMQRANGGVVRVANLISLAYLESEPWYFGDLKRNDAENFLKNESNIEGSFLIRYSGLSGDHLFTLSVRSTNKEIKHYKIDVNKEETGNNVYYSISSKGKYKNLSELLGFFSKTDGLCVCLTRPCKK